MEGEGERGRERKKESEAERESEWALCDQKACLFSWRLNSSGATLGLSALSSSQPHRLPDIPATGSGSQRGAGPRQNQNKHLKHGKCLFKQFETHLIQQPGHLNSVQIEFKQVLLMCDSHAYTILFDFFLVLEMEYFYTVVVLLFLKEGI